MLRKVDGYVAASSSGRRLSKKAKSKQEALKQLYAVEMSQAREAEGKGKKGKVSKRRRRRVSRAIANMAKQRA